MGVLSALPNAIKAEIYQGVKTRRGWKAFKSTASIENELKFQFELDKRLIGLVDARHGLMCAP